MTRAFVLAATADVALAAAGLAVGERNRRQHVMVLGAMLSNDELANAHVGDPVRVRATGALGVIVGFYRRRDETVLVALSTKDRREFRLDEVERLGRSRQERAAQNAP